VCVGGEYPQRAQPHPEIATFGSDNPDPLQQLVFGVVGRHDRRQAGHRDAERQLLGPQHPGQLAGRQPITDPQAGQPVGLGEGPHHHDVRKTPNQRRHVDPVLRRGELDVRLVEHHDGVARHAAQESEQLGRRLQRAGRVVWPAHHHYAGIRSDVGQPVEVVMAVLIERYGHRPQPRHLRNDRIAVERR